MGRAKKPGATGVIPVAPAPFRYGITGAEAPWPYVLKADPQ